MGLHCSLSVLALTSMALASPHQFILGDEKPVKVPGENPFEYCKDPEPYIMQISTLDLSSKEPKAGDNVTITLSGHASEAIKDLSVAQLSVSLKLGRATVPIIREAQDLCDGLKDLFDLDCPLEGDVKGTSKNITLPNEIPAGKYLLVLDAKSREEKEITCLQGVLQF